MTPAARIKSTIEILDQMRRQHRPASVILKDWSNNNRYAGSNDRVWISSLLYDTLRYRSSLFYLLDSERHPELVLSTLLLIWFWDREKIKFICDGEHHNYGPITSYVDQMLQEAEKKYAALQVASIDPDATAAPLIANVPEDFWREFVDQFGEDAIAEGRALSSRAPIDIRVNGLRRTIAEVSNDLDHFSPKPINFVRGALRIEPPRPGERAAPVEREIGFAQGNYEVQDVGSQLVSQIAQYSRPKKILDYCAGAGGKSLAMAPNLPSGGEIYCYDNDSRRLSKSVERIERAGVRTIQLVNPSLKSALDKLEGEMDLVLVDAPCTGSGTWRRRPDAKWRLSRAQFEHRQQEQLQILAESAKYVRPGGDLAYITCSVFPKENQKQVQHFLMKHPEFQVRPITQIIVETFDGQGDQLLRRSYAAGEGRLFTPFRTGTDGFFIALLTRSSG